MSSFVSGTAQGTTPQQQASAAGNLLKVAEQQRKILETSLAAATTEKERLSIQRELLTVERDIVKARTTQMNAIVAQQQERILGIAPHSAPGVQSLRTRERQILIQEIGRFAGPIKGETAAQRAAGVVPDAVTAPLRILIKQMQAAGIEIPKATLESLRKINQVLAISEKHGGKLNSLVEQNVTARLAQINDTLKAALGGRGSNYRLPTEREVLRRAGLSHLSGEDRKRLGAELAGIEEAHGRVPKGASVLGILATHGGLGDHPELNQGRYAETRAAVSVGHINIYISGEHKSPKQIAEEVRTALSRTARRNATQTRGPNAGRNLGHN
jgi:hypothetical protein